MKFVIEMENDIDREELIEILGENGFDGTPSGIISMDSKPSLEECSDKELVMAYLSSVICSNASYDSTGINVTKIRKYVMGD
jgi:hypothetical protein